MAFEIGDKVLTNTGLYMTGAWREAGLKGKVVAKPEAPEGRITVKFKGIEVPRFMDPRYVILRGKKNRPFKEGDTVATKEAVYTDTYSVSAGADAEVVEVIPDSNLVVVEFLHGGEATLSEDILTKTEVVADEEEEQAVDGYWTPEPADPDFEPEEYTSAPEVQAALALVLERIEEIKTLLTTKPHNEVVFNIHPANGLSEEQVSEALREEEPAPEPVFKKAKEVKVGELLYTEGGAYDKVDRVDTKASGYTSLYGAFGNRIAQIPSGRVVQVLEEVS